MTQAQLLALDTILPTVLGCAGLVFLAAALWPLGTQGRVYAARAAALGAAGVACIAVGVWLWLSVLHTASQLIVQQVPPPGGTSSVTTAQKPSAPPSTAASTVASSAPVASAAPSASAAPVPTAATSASAAASAPASAGPTPVPPTPTLPPNLTPVPVATFAPETSPAHAAVIGVESFEHGSMLYRDDLKHIYVMTLDQKFKVYPDTWNAASQPDLAFVDGAKFHPGRGFGWLWGSNPDIRQTLGEALTAEQGFTGSISGDGTTTTIKADVSYAFNKDGTWALK